jgi:hypothetical protein
LILRMRQAVLGQATQAVPTRLAFTDN